MKKNDKKVAVKPKVVHPIRKQPEEMKKNIVYNGLRPENDEDNNIRDKLVSIFGDLASLHEIRANKFHLAYLKEDSATKFTDDFKDLINFKFLFVPFEYTKIIHYDSFNHDFGPLSLGAIHMFISKMKVLFDTLDHRKEDCIVIVVDQKCQKKLLNATFLVSATALTLFQMTDEELLKKLKFSFMNPNCKDRYRQVFLDQNRFFSDVSGFKSRVRLTLKDCIEAFYLALKLNFYNYQTFDHVDYLFYEMVQTGDINWIVPGKLLAFAGPSDKNNLFRNKHKPSFYIDYFRQRNVTDIVRLNEPDYNEASFKEAGFKHHDLIFPDGLPPTSTIALKFLKIVDEAKGGVAVHCFAGIGRTGTLIAAYLVSKYGFTPESAIAWTRICRPGSVIGDQQDWLLRYFEKRTIPGSTKEAIEANKSVNNITISNQATNNTKIEQDVEMAGTSADEADKNEEEDDDTGNEQANDGHADYQATHRELGQAQALVRTKQRRKLKTQDNPQPIQTKQLHTKYRIITRASSKRKGDTQKPSMQNPEPDTNSTTKSADINDNEIILDLGKTLPFSFLTRSLAGYYEAGVYPPFYELHDGFRSWKVKFPKPDYVTLRLNIDTDKTIDQNEIVEEPQIVGTFSLPRKGDKRKKPYPNLEPYMLLGKQVGLMSKLYLCSSSFNCDPDDGDFICDLPDE